MRSEKEMFELIIKTAEEDDRINAVLLAGSRANDNIPKDMYQDYDIQYFVKDIKPFYNNIEWIISKFGNPIIMQLPETMELIQPSGDGHFCWLMIFDDGIRIDLSMESTQYTDDGEPVIILLDKDNFFPKLDINYNHWNIKPPSVKYYYDCCNEFWWCLNNVAKGIARDELPYAMNMYNCIVKDMLDKMIEWFIGVNNDFSVSSGKNGKYFKNYLPNNLYENYKRTYSDSDYNNFWNAIFCACGLFSIAAKKVANYLNITYNQNDENGIIKYLNMIKNDYNKNG